MSYKAGLGRKFPIIGYVVDRLVLTNFTEMLSRGPDPLARKNPKKPRRGFVAHDFHRKKV